MFCITFYISLCKNTQCPFAHSVHTLATAGPHNSCLFVYGVGKWNGHSKFLITHAFLQIQSFLIKTYKLVHPAHSSGIKSRHTTEHLCCWAADSAGKTWGLSKLTQGSRVALNNNKKIKEDNQQLLLLLNKHTRASKMNNWKSKNDPVIKLARVTCFAGQTPSFAFAVKTT